MKNALILFLSLMNFNSLIHAQTSGEYKVYLLNEKTTTITPLNLNLSSNQLINHELVEYSVSETEPTSFPINSSGANTELSKLIQGLKSLNTPDRNVIMVYLHTFEIPMIKKTWVTIHPKSSPSEIKSIFKDRASADQYIKLAVQSIPEELNTVIGEEYSLEEDELNNSEVAKAVNLQRTEIYRQILSRVDHRGLPTYVYFISKVNIVHPITGFKYHGTYLLSLLTLNTNFTPDNATFFKPVSGKLRSGILDQQVLIEMIPFMKSKFGDIDKANNFVHYCRESIRLGEIDQLLGSENIGKWANSSFNIIEDEEGIKLGLKSLSLEEKIKIVTLMATDPLDYGTKANALEHYLAITIVKSIIKSTSENEAQAFIDAFSNQPINLLSNNRTLPLKPLFNYFSEKYLKQEEFAEAIFHLSQKNVNNLKSKIAQNQVSNGSMMYFPTYGLLTSPSSEACVKADGSIMSYDVSLPSNENKLDLKISNLKVQKAHDVGTASYMNNSNILVTRETCTPIPITLDNSFEINPFTIVGFSHNTCVQIAAGLFAGSTNYIDPSTVGEVILVPAYYLAHFKEVKKRTYIKNTAYYSVMALATVSGLSTISAASTTIQKALLVSDGIELASASVQDLVRNNRQEDVELHEWLDKIRMGNALVAAPFVLREMNNLYKAWKRTKELIASTRDPKIIKDLKTIEQGLQVELIKSGYKPEQLLDLLVLFDNIKDEYKTTAFAFNKLFKVEKITDPLGVPTLSWRYITGGQGTEFIEIARVRYASAGAKGDLVLYTDVITDINERFLKIGEEVRASNFKMGDKNLPLKLDNLEEIENQSITFYKGLDGKPVCHMPGYCFVAGTRVLTKYGLVNIEHLFEFLDGRYPIQVPIQEFKK